MHSDFDPLGSTEQTNGRIGEFLESFAHGRYIGHAHGGELHAPRQTFEQSEAKMRLESADLIADRR